MCCVPLPITGSEYVVFSQCFCSDPPAQWVLLHVIPLPSLVLQTPPPEEGPQEQRVPPLGVRGEPVHNTGRVLQLPLHSSHLICASPRAAALKPRLSLTVSLRQTEIETSHSFVFWTFSLWKNITCTCQSVAWVIFWLTGLDVAVFCLPRCPVCQLVPLLSSLTHSMCCAALHCTLFFRCVR